jgi:hypothetical protein
MLLSILSMSGVEELQHDLRVWYASFKQKQAARVREVVRSAMLQRDSEEHQKQ